MNKNEQIKRKSFDQRIENGTCPTSIPHWWVVWQIKEAKHNTPKMGIPSGLDHFVYHDCRLTLSISEENRFGLLNRTPILHNPSCTQLMLDTNILLGQNDNLCSHRMLRYVGMHFNQHNPIRESQLNLRISFDPIHFMGICGLLLELICCFK